MIRSLSVLALLCLALPAGAATLTGRVVNGTTGEPGRADEVAVVDITRGSSEPVASLSDVSGEFTLEGIPDAAAPHFRVIVRANGIETSQALASFDEPMDVFVYEATDALDGIVLLRHHVFFARDPEHIQVTEYMEFENRTDPPVLIRGGSMPMRIVLDHDIHGEPVTSLLDTAAPVDLDTRPTDEAGVSGVVYDLQPGITRIYTRYLMHEEGQAMAWNSRSLFDTEERRVFVAPTDIEVASTGAMSIDSPIEDYGAYALPPASAGDAFVVTLSGGSAVTATATDQAQGQQANRASAYEDIVSRPNRLTTSRNTIFLGLGALLLFAALGALGMSRKPVEDPATADESRLAVSKIADRYVSGEISREEYEREAARLLKKGGPKASPAG